MSQGIFFAFRSSFEKNGGPRQGGGNRKNDERWNGPDKAVETGRKMKGGKAPTRQWKQGEKQKAEKDEDGKRKLDGVSGKA